MLVLTRRIGESLRIGTDVRVTVLASSGGQVRLGIQAPSRVPVHREEVVERIAEANREAAQLPDDGALAALPRGLRGRAGRDAAGEESDDGE